MTIRDRFMLRFLRRLVRTPAGRAHLLDMVADAEANGELEIFDRLLLRVDDGALQKMIRKHRDDEVRHQALFRARAEAQGVRREPVPRELQLISRIEEQVGGFDAASLAAPREVMEAYALLQVIEERAITQFPLMERAFREVDPETADVFAQVARDEQRHLKYCHAITRVYAPDKATLDATLERFRIMEAEAFGANSDANLEYVMKRGWIAPGRLDRFLMRVAQGLEGIIGGLPTTRYAAQS